MPDDDIVEKMARKYGGGAAVADDPVERLAAKYGKPPVEDPVDALAAKYAAPARTDIPPVLSGAFREPYAAPDSPVDPARRRALIKERGLPSPDENALQAEYDALSARNPRFVPGSPDEKRARELSTVLNQMRGEYREDIEKSVYEQAFPEMRTTADFDFRDEQKRRSDLASRTAGQVEDASVPENLAKKSPLFRAGVGALTAPGKFIRGVSAGLIPAGGDALDKLSAALESTDGWTKYLHAGAEGIGAGVGIGKVAGGIGITKAMGLYGAVATPGDATDRAGGGLRMIAFGKLAQILTPSTQKMLARLPAELRGPVIAKAIDLLDEAAGGAGSEIVMGILSDGEVPDAKRILFSGALNAAQASLRKVAVEMPPSDTMGDGLAQVRGEEMMARAEADATAPDAVPDPTTDTPEVLRARGLARIEAAEAQDATGEAPEAQVAPVEAQVPQPAPEAPAAPREEVIQPRAGEPTAETPPPVAPPAPRETASTPDGFPESIKNAAVAESRAKRMLGPLAEPARLANQEALDTGLAAIEANPDKPYQIAKRLAESAAEPTPLEGAILLAHRVKLQHEMNLAYEEGVRAAADGDADGIKDARETEAKAEAAMADADLVAKRSGTEKGRELQFRKVLAGEDYTVEGIRRKVRSAGDFKPLSHDELAQTKAAGDKITELTKARDAQTEKAETAEAHKVIDEIAKAHVPKDAEPVAPTEYGKTNKIVTKEAADAALARILARARESKTNVMFDPTVLKDYVIRGAYHVEAGARTFGRWAKAMKKEFGEEIGPHLRGIYDEARKELSGKDIEDISAEMSKGVKDGKAMSAQDVGKVAEALVRSGVHGSENISKAIHEVLKKVSPEITQSESNRILVKYGQIVKMNADPVKVELRDIKAQLVQIERLKDMDNKIPPPRQGLQRDTPSDALRELNRRVEEARRKGGFRVVDPARQLKSTLDGIQKRWKNEAADKIKEIEAGRKVIPVKSDPLANADAATKAQHAAAKAEIDAVRKRYREVFGKSSMTDAQRAEAALKAVEKSIAELKRRAKAGDVFPEKVDPVQGPVEERMAELLAEQKELREVIKDIHDLYDPKLTENEKTVRRLNRTLDALNAQIDSGTVPGKKARVEKPLSPEALQIEQKILEAKREVDKIVQSKMREQETRAAQVKRIAIKEIPSLLRVWGITFDFGSTLVQGGFRSLSHPIEMARTFGKGLKSFASASARDADDARILNDPAYATANKQKSGLTGLEPGRVVDEAIRSRWMHDTWGLRNFERFTHTMLNNMRLNASKTMNKKTQDNWLLRLTQAIGVASSRTGVPTPAEAKAIGEGVNILTGRGTSRSHRVNQFLDSATVIALAPRYSLSTFQAALGTPMWRGTARTRTAFATEYGRAAISVGALIGVGMAFGWTPDKFGILHKGTMSFDPSMGMARVWKLATKVYGSLFNDSDEMKGEDRAYAGRYAQQRLHPLAGALWSRTTGKTVGGKEATYEQLGEDIVTPMILKDFLKAKENEGVPTGLLMLGLSAIGARASSYQPKADERGRRKGGR